MRKALAGRLAGRSIRPCTATALQGVCSGSGQHAVAGALASTHCSPGVPQAPPRTDMPILSLVEKRNDGSGIDGPSYDLGIGLDVRGG